MEWIYIREFRSQKNKDGVPEVELKTHKYKVLSVGRKWITVCWKWDDNPWMSGRERFTPFGRDSLIHEEKGMKSVSEHAGVFKIDKSIFESIYYNAANISCVAFRFYESEEAITDEDDIVLSTYFRNNVVETIQRMLDLVEITGDLTNGIKNK